MTFALGLVFIFGLVSLAQGALLVRSRRTAARDRARLATQANELRAGATLIRQALASVEETFLIFGPDAVCFANCSPHATDVFGREPENESLAKLLNVLDADEFAIWYRMLFTHAFETVAELGPRHFVTAATKRTYRLRFVPMREDGRVENVIVTFTDVTDTLHAQAASAEAARRAEFVLAVAQHPADFARLVQRLQTLDIESFDTDELRRELHTLKGIAGLFYARSLVEIIHRIELELAAGRVLEPTDLRLARAATEFVTSERTVLRQLRVFENDDLVVTRGVLAQTKLEFGRDPASRTAFDRVVSRLGAREIAPRLLAFDHPVRALAERLGKRAEVTLDTASEFAALLTPRYDAVFDALVHLFNNAVDHGLETPSERVARGKSPVGRVIVGVHRARLGQTPAVSIRVEDDGAGIDPSVLRRTLTKAGVDLVGVGDAELLPRIFDLGVTTRTVATDVSGLGVGLSGLRALVEAAGGAVDVRSRIGQGTTFELRLPAPPEDVWFAAIDLAWSIAAA